MPTFLIKKVVWWATTLPTLHGYMAGSQRTSVETRKSLGVQTFRFGSM
ncbi:MAG: hypothetical protein KAI83_03720 [Thiomargarita sp.]|nr:hypothetical protein [Thiomargarita sp.]